jgi:hypothetical protein
MAQPKTLNVVANPFCHLDHEGRPAGAAQREPNPHVHSADIFYVGAVRKFRQIDAGKPALGIAPIEEYTFEFSPDAVPVANSDYYRRLVKSRELLAADKESWVAAGADPATYVDPKTALAHAKAGAIAQHKAAHGEEPAGIPSEAPAAQPAAAAAKKGKE